MDAVVKLPSSCRFSGCLLIVIVLGFFSDHITSVKFVVNAAQDEQRHFHITGLGFHTKSPTESYPDVLGY